MNALDGPDLLAADRSGMLTLVEHLGDHMAEAWRAHRPVAGLRNGAPHRQVVLTGMGGSATAADYLAALCRDLSSVPVTVYRGTQPPASVGPGTLVVAISFSGNTDESLQCFEDARKRGARLAAITSGGRLAGMAEEAGAACLRVGMDAPPRAALGQLLGAVLRVAEAAGLPIVDDRNIETAAAAHRKIAAHQLAPAVSSTTNIAKQLAPWIVDGIPFIVGADHLAPVAVRFKNQLGENGKWMAAAESLPELAHNLVVGASPEVATRGARVIAFESSLYGPPLSARVTAAVRLFEECGIPTRTVPVAGATRLEQMLVATALADYTSCYVALLRGIDPTPIPQIETLKEAVSRNL